jgi:amidophosphoribosyltransferase
VLELHEKCGIFGVYGQNLEAARLVLLGLWQLQHRGQEGSGIVSTDGNGLYVHKGTGLVAHVYSEADLSRLPGHAAIGHNRYSTSGGSIADHVQPVYIGDNLLALAHNGNLPDTTKLELLLREHGISTNGRNDSELMHLALTYYLVKGASLAEAVRECMPLFTGVYSLLLLTSRELVALRDPHGVRPLVIGELEGNWLISSESCALTTLEAQHIREICPGEMVVITDGGMESYQLAPSQLHVDAFEFVYFARPDSEIAGCPVELARWRMGVELARVGPSVDVDVVVGVPDSAIPSAMGYAHESGIPNRLGLVKNRYIHRTFIRPDGRRDSVDLKLNTVRHILNGKRVVIIDDSIVRGVTSRQLVKKVRQAGAREVHLRISSPPVRFPDFYGIDTPRSRDLLAANMDSSSICQYVGADSLAYLPLEGLLRAIDVPREQLCLSCFTGEYPVDIGRRASDILR